MPILGHAIVGVVTAQVFEPAADPEHVQRRAARMLWMPALVLLAYAPDILTQIGALLGSTDFKIAAHSLPFGCVAGAVIGATWARVTSGRPRTFIALAVGSILIHDVLDLMQSDDRVPFWPFSSAIVAPGWLNARGRLANEAIVFGVPFAAYEAYRLIRRLRVEGLRTIRNVKWPAWAAVVLIALGVLGFQQLRRQRGVQLRSAERLARQGEYVAALAAADKADRWPIGSRGASVDLVRGNVQEALGNLASAEQFFLSAQRRDPDSFWAVASLAEFYASHGTPEERRERTEPYLVLLRSRFAQEPSYQRVVTRLERLVNRVQGTDADSSGN